MKFDDILESVDIYQPLRLYLDEFRLLTVSKGGYDEPIKCKLRRTSLDRDYRMRYETVSYCWGQAKYDTGFALRRRAVVIVNGQRLNVPASCEGALRHIRMPDQDREVWIDAICINQSDVKERGDQVSMMGLIYRMAAGNLIHLGEFDRQLNTEILLSTAQRVRDIRKLPLASLSLDTTSSQVTETSSCTVARMLSQRIDKLLAPRRLQPDFSLAETKDLPFIFGKEKARLLKQLYEEVIEPELEFIFTSPWFTRLWVVQEASLARRNTCFVGQSSFPLEDMLQLAIVVYNHTAKTKTDIFENARTGRYIRRFIRTDFEIPKTVTQANNGVELYHYVKLSQDLSCLDPHDRIYAIMEMYKLQHGLSSLPTSLRPDYGKPAAKGFRDMTRLALSGRSAAKLLDMVHHKTDHDINDDGLPSWSIRWHHQSRDDLPHTGRDHHCGSRTRDNEHGLKIAPCKQPHILSINGFVVARVANHGVCFTSKRLNSVPSLRSGIATIYGLLNTKLSRRVYPCNIWDQMLSTLLTSGRDYKRSMRSEVALFTKAHNDFQTQKEAFVKFYSYLNTYDTLPSISRLQTDADEAIGTIIRYFGTFYGESKDRRLCQLDTGHLCSGPAILREGDVLAIFIGGENAHVLRPIGKEYQVLGSAHVEGLMHGEVFDMGLFTQWIDLR